MRSQLVNRYICMYECLGKLYCSCYCYLFMYAVCMYVCTGSVCMSVNMHMRVGGTADSRQHAASDSGRMKARQSKLRDARTAWHGMAPAIKQASMLVGRTPKTCCWTQTGRAGRTSIGELELCNSHGPRPGNNGGLKGKFQVGYEPEKLKNLVIHRILGYTMNY